MDIFFCFKNFTQIAVHTYFSVTCFFPFTKIFQMSLEFHISDKQEVASSPPAMLASGSLEGFGVLGYACHSALSRAARKFPFAHLCRHVAMLVNICQPDGWETMFPSHFGSAFPGPCAVALCFSAPHTSSSVNCFFGSGPFFCGLFGFPLLACKCYFFCDLDIVL